MILRLLGQHVVGPWFRAARWPVRTESHNILLVEDILLGPKLTFDPTICLPDSDWLISGPGRVWMALLRQSLLLKAQLRAFPRDHTDT